MKNPHFLAAATIAAGICFVGGFAIGKVGEYGDSRPESSSIGAREERKVLTAITKSQNPAVRSIAALAHSTEFGLHEKFTGYLRLIDAAEPDEIADLFSAIRREVSSEIGSQSLLVALAQHWAEVDPRAAFDALLSGTPQGIDWGTDAIIGVLAKSDPETAWKSLIAADLSPEIGSFSGNATRRSQIVEKLLWKAAEVDPDRVIKFIETIENPGSYRNEITMAVSRISASSPELVLASIDRFPISRANADNLIANALAQLAIEEGAGVTSRLENLRGRTRLTAAAGIARGLAESDPDAALEMASTLKGAARSSTEYQVVSLQAAKDPAAAAANALKISSPAVRAQVAHSVAREWHYKDRDAALAWVREDLEGTARDRAYAELLKLHVTYVDFDENFDRMFEMADGSRESATGPHQDFANEWAKRDPAAAAEWAAARRVGSYALFSRIAPEWAQSDPAALSAFAKTLNDERLRRLAEDHVKHAEASKTEEAGE